MVDWAESAASVNKATGGRVGYIYIPDCSEAGLIESSRMY